MDIYIRYYGPGVVCWSHGGNGELGCLCGKAGTSHLCDGSAHSSGCVVNGSNAICRLSYYYGHGFMDIKQIHIRYYEVSCDVSRAQVWLSTG